MTPAETKRAVTTRVLEVFEKSPSAEGIDKKALVFQISTGFDVLFDGASFDLVPLWRSLNGDSDVPRFSGLFLRIEESLAEISVSVRQADSVLALNPEQRVEALDRALGRGRLQRAASGTRDPRSQLMIAFVGAIRASPIASKMSLPQLQGFMTPLLPELFDGARFDVRRVTEWMAQHPEVTEEDVYPAIVRFRAILSEKKLTLVEPDWKLSAAKRQIIEDQVLRPQGRATPTPTSDPAQQSGRIELPQKPRNRRFRLALLAIIFISSLGGAGFYHMKSHRRPYLRPVEYAVQNPEFIECEVREAEGEYEICKIAKDKWSQYKGKDRSHRLHNSMIRALKEGRKGIVYRDLEGTFLSFRLPTRFDANIVPSTAAK